MLRLIVLNAAAVLSLGSLSNCSLPHTPGESAGSYVIDGVTVIDVVTGRGIPSQRVVITGSRIRAMGSAANTAAPADATVVDGAGKYLIPGLWDMHVHALQESPRDKQLALFLANGVTGIRDLGSGVKNSVRWRNAVASSSVLGPRIVIAGVLVDGAPAAYPEVSTTVTTPEQARRAVASLASRGVDFIKAYEMLRPEVYAALATEARARGIPYAGHLPLTVSAEDAVRAGHKSFEHLRNMDVACSSKADSLRSVAADMLQRGEDQRGLPLRSQIHAAIRPRALETHDEARCASLVRMMAQAGAWHVPNLVLQTQGFFRHDTTAFFQRWVPFLPVGLRQSWRRSTADITVFIRCVRDKPCEKRPLTAEETARSARQAQWFLDMTKRLHEAGVGILPGSDYNNPVMIPGASIHEELALFVRAGLSSAAALRAATLQPAVYLGLADSLGTIAPGKLADLVLLDADPLQDIRNVARVHAVWRGGRYLDRATIEHMLDRLR